MAKVPYSTYSLSFAGALAAQTVDPLHFRLLLPLLLLPLLLLLLLALLLLSLPAASAS